MTQTPYQFEQQGAPLNTHTAKYSRWWQLLTWCDDAPERDWVERDPGVLITAVGEGADWGSQPFLTVAQIKGGRGKWWNITYQLCDPNKTRHTGPIHKYNSNSNRNVTMVCVCVPSDWHDIFPQITLHTVTSTWAGDQNNTHTYCIFTLWLLKRTREADCDSESTMLGHIFPVEREPQGDILLGCFCAWRQT